MEPRVATSGNRWQTRPLPKRLKKAKTFAVVRDQLPFGAHGKEGVDPRFDRSPTGARMAHAARFAAAFCRVSVTNTGALNAAVFYRERGPCTAGTDYRGL
jgi:hypothetical protein